MTLLYGHDDTVTEWCERKMGGHMVFPHIAIGMLDKAGVLRGAFLLARHNAATVELTLYSEGVIRNGHWRGMCEFVFGNLGATRLQIRTDRKNRAVKRAAPKFGFAFEGVSRSFWGPGQDALCFFMTPQTCRWMKNGGPIQEQQGANVQR